MGGLSENHKAQSINKQLTIWFKTITTPQNVKLSSVRGRSIDCYIADPKLASTKLEWPNFFLVKFANVKAKYDTQQRHI